MENCLKKIPSDYCGVDNRFIALRNSVVNSLNIFLIGANSMQGWTATMSHGVKEKEAQKHWSIQEICLQRTYS